MVNQKDCLYKKSKTSYYCFCMCLITSLYGEICQVGCGEHDCWELLLESLRNPSRQTFFLPIQVSVTLIVSNLT